MIAMIRNVMAQDSIFLFDSFLPSASLPWCLPRGSKAGRFPFVPGGSTVCRDDFTASRLNNAVFRLNNTTCHDNFTAFRVNFTIFRDDFTVRWHDFTTCRVNFAVSREDFTVSRVDYRGLDAGFPFQVISRRRYFQC